jgi:hypothetical protein
LGESPGSRPWLPPSNVRSGSSNSRRTARSCNCLAFVGYTLEEIAAKPAATLAPDFDFRAVWDALRRGECHVQQHRWLTKQGQEI